jgi:tetratricopeptide (TPR) repeat protein
VATRLDEFARRKQMIVMAGAGVSAGNPSALPGWNALNAAIVRVLCNRVELAAKRWWPERTHSSWLDGVESFLDAERSADRFPPEYQAQIVEEMCGERYFRALQALDIDVLNSAHAGIAALAAAGVLRAVVTTNFGRLIERALDRRKVSYQVAYDDAGFAEMGERLRQNEGGPLPIIKIHGCVSDHLSMIDTLKQRKRGRARHLESCLDPLHSGFWLYLGFSAADLESDPTYLRLVAGAQSSAGATYVAFPERPDLRKGAQVLMGAYGDRGRVVVADIASYLREVCLALGAPEAATIPTETELGRRRFQEKLEVWAATLSFSSAGLCLAGILEAVGQSEPAVRIMDRLVRKELNDERDTPDYRLLQLHYGRLGAAFGRFVAVPERFGGGASDASIETEQSLSRLLDDSELGFAASSWSASASLWLNWGAAAVRTAGWILNGFLKGTWENRSPRSDEEVVDAWTCLAQVFALNTHNESLDFAAATYQAALGRAQRCGDVVRTARVLALYLLALAETSEDVPSLSEQYAPDFAEAERVGDGFALGFRLLALGRWHVAVGGLTLAQRSAIPSVVPQRALELLHHANKYFVNQGMDPWQLFTIIQMAKALANLHRFDEAKQCFDHVDKGLERFPILASHLYEAIGSVQLIVGNPDAQSSIDAAINAAQKSGLLARRETLLRHEALRKGAAREGA